MALLEITTFVERVKHMDESFASDDHPQSSGAGCPYCQLGPRERSGAGRPYYQLEMNVTRIKRSELLDLVERVTQFGGLLVVFVPDRQVHFLAQNFGATLGFALLDLVE